MPEPRFLTIDRVLAVQADMIRRYGGSPALLNRGLLESAVAMPEQQFGGQLPHEDFASQAAAYLYHLVQNHSFEDGNKRVGSAAAVVFLLMNQVQIEFSEQQLVDLTLNVATGTMTKDEVTAFFRQYTSPSR